MNVIFYQGRFPATLCNVADKTSFFRAGARVFAQRGPVSASLLAIDKSGSVVRDVLNELQFTYSAYGYAVGLANGHCRLGFNGELYDNCFQGYLLGGKRAFIPSRPGFNSPDELNIRGDELNVMSYCSGDPVNYSDPSGRTRTNINPLLDLRRIAATRVIQEPRVLKQLQRLNGSKDFVGRLDPTGGNLYNRLAYLEYEPYIAETRAMEPAVFKHYFKGVPNGGALAKSISAMSVDSFFANLAVRMPFEPRVKLVPMSPGVESQKIVLLGMLPQDAKNLMSALKPYQRRVIGHLSRVRPDPALFHYLYDDSHFRNSLPNSVEAQKTYNRIMGDIRRR